MESGKNGLKDNQQESKDGGGRTSKFLYKASSHKSDPWTKNTNEDEEFDVIIKPNIFSNGKERNKTSPSFALEDVWSIRKNVQVTTSVKNGSALKTNTNKFYSRHGGLSGNFDTNTTLTSKKQNIEDEMGQSSSGWSVPRQGYSYSDNRCSQNRSSPAKGFGDIIADKHNARNEDEDFETRKNKLNARLPMPGAPQTAVREMSARTRKSHTFLQAHMKSSGLGQFSTPSVAYARQYQGDNDSTPKWKTKK